jgi:transposase-like protein
MILTKEHFADVNSRVQSGELSPGEAYKLLGAIQRDKQPGERIESEDKIEMIRLYTNENKTCKQIGALVGCHEMTVRHHLLAAGVKMRGRAESARVKLTEDDVRDIRASSESSSVLARKYGVHVSRITGIRAGRTRTNVPDFTLPEGLEGSRQALNMLPAQNEAIQSELRKALKHAETTGHLLKTVSNVA